MRNVVFALLVAAAPAAASAQVIQPGALTAEVEVHVVNVDVSVMDVHGHPVTDLTKDDFEIFEDGKAQKVTNFAVIRNTAAGAQGGVSAPRPTPERRRILLIVDNNYIGVSERNRALDTIEKYLNESFPAEWGVVAIGHTADTLQSFTADRKLVHNALLNVRRMASAEATHQIDRTPVSERFIRKNDITEPVDFSHKMAMASREQTFRQLMAMQNTARAVVDTARSYAAEDGKKFIILVTGGVELNTTFSTFDNDDRELHDLKTQIAQVVDAMVREANGANFTVHVINARGRADAAPQHDVSNRSSGLVSSTLLRDPGNEPIDVSDPDSIPIQLAYGTGGMYLPSADIHESLQKIDALTSNFYSLGYSPDHNGDRAYHTIKVKVKRSGVRVANRVGYFDETPEDRLEAMLRARMKFDDGFGSIPVTVEVGEASTAENRDLVLPVTGTMPISRITVIPQDQGFVGRVHVYCSVFDESGNNVGFSHQVKKVMMSAEQVQNPGDFRYTMKVRLKRGAFTIVVTLRDELSNELGSASEAIHL